MLSHRPATVEDAPLLAELNHQLIRDEGHRNPMTVAELEQRMRDWLAADYNAILFEKNGATVAYALYREQLTEIYLRQLFVTRGQRSKGIGRQALEILRTKIWPQGKRLSVSVLTSNTRAVKFWREAGFSDYCLTLEIMPDIPRIEIV